MTAKDRKHLTVIYSLVLIALVGVSLYITVSLSTRA